MKLKGEFELIPKDEFEKQVIAHGEAEKRFGSFLASNEVGNYIFQFLMKETTVDEVVKNMTLTFEAPEEDIREDVNSVVSALRNLGYLEEN